MVYLFNQISGNFDEIIEFNTISTYLNPYQYLILRKNENLLLNIDLFFFDGFLLNFFYNLICRKKIETQPPDLSGFLPELFQKVISNSEPIVLIGGAEVDNKLATQNIIKLFPKIQIGYQRNGYLSTIKEIDQCIEIIIKNNFKYVLVGMGIPNQEIFIVKLKQSGFEGVAITCGGFFHQTAKRKNYYHEFIVKYNLRWIHRVVDEPKLLYRYLIIYPIGIFIFIVDLVKYKKSIPK